MFLFATSQAIAATQTKQRERKARSHEKLYVERSRNRRGFLWRLFDALAQSRMRRAQVEIEHQRRLREGQSKK